MARLSHEWLFLGAVFSHYQEPFLVLLLLLILCKLFVPAQWLHFRAILLEKGKDDGRNKTPGGWMGIRDATEHPVLLGSNKPCLV